MQERNEEVAEGSVGVSDNIPAAGTGAASSAVSGSSGSSPDTATPLAGDESTLADEAPPEDGVRSPGDSPLDSSGEWTRLSPVVKMRPV